MNHKIEAGTKLTVTIQNEEGSKDATITQVVRTRLTDLKILFEGEKKSIRLQYDNQRGHEELQWGHTVNAYLIKIGKNQIVTACSIKVKPK